MKKRIVAVLLAAAMVVGCAGCGNTEQKGMEVSKESVVEASTQKASSEVVEEEPKEPVTICYYYKNGVGEQQYTTQVEEKLNEILKGIEGYEHISIDLVPCNDYPTEFTLAQASGAQIDMFATYGLDLGTLVSNGDIIPLDDLLAEFPYVTSEIPDWLVEMGAVDGVQYMIPAYQQAVKINYHFGPAAYFDMYKEVTGKTDEDIADVIAWGSVAEKMEFWEDLCYAVREETGLDTKWLGWWFFPGAFFNFEFVGANYGNLILREGADVPEYWPTSEDYKTHISYLAKWYEEGLIHPEFSTVKSSDFEGNNGLNDEAFIIGISEGSCSAEQLAAKKSSDFPSVAYPVSDHGYLPSKYAAGGNAIYTDCEHPEEAMMIMELLMTKKGEEFYNTLVYGLEGIHWEWVDEENNEIKTLEYNSAQGGSTSTYHAWKWNIGNSFNAWRNQAVNGEEQEYIVEVLNEGEDTVKSPALGITWDLSPVADQVSQCTAVDKEYQYSVIMAGSDWEAKYDEYMEKLEAAGVQDIVDCVTQQYKDFLASH